jgi:hypothetical protein
MLNILNSILNLNKKGNYRKLTFPTLKKSLIGHLNAFDLMKLIELQKSETCKRALMYYNSI